MIQTMWGNFAPHDKQISCLQTHSYKIINIVKLILWQVFLVTSFFALSFSENGCSGKIYVDDHDHCYEDKILHYGCCQKAQTAFTHGTRRWFLWNKIPHGWFLDFWDGMGGGNHHTKFQNRLLQDISSGRKWGEFPRFWEVLCFDMCFQISVLVIGSAVSEISQFARFSIWLQNIWRCVPAFPRVSDLAIASPSFVSSASLKVLN